MTRHFWKAKILSEGDELFTGYLRNANMRAIYMVVGPVLMLWLGWFMVEWTVFECRIVELNPYVDMVCGY